MAGLLGFGRRENLSKDARLAVGRNGSGKRARNAAGYREPRRASGMEPLENRLLMSAVRMDAAFNLTDFGRGDERSTTSPTSGLSLNFSSPINFFGTTYSSLFINNNGNVSFGSRNSTFADAPFSALSSKLIAPFYADVDTRSGGLSARWGRGTVDGHAAFGVNWIDVNFFNSSVAHTNGFNSFQLVLIDRSDLGAGNFDIEFNYDKILWESGMNQNGGNTAGLGGSSARVGFGSGSSAAGSFFELAGSGLAGSFLDSNPNGLIHGRFMSDVDGRYVYRFRNGTWADAPNGGGTNTVPVLYLPDTLVLAENPGGLTSIPEGAGGFFEDPDNDVWNITVNYGDGTELSLPYDEFKNFTFVHDYAGTGVYELVVTVDDGHGTLVQGSTVVTVIDMTPPVISVSAPESVSEGSWVTVSATLDEPEDPNDPVTFAWMSDLNGTVSADGRSFTLYADDNGTYLVQVVATDMRGFTTVVDVPLLVTNVAPTADGLSGGSSLDEGGLVNFSLLGASDLSGADLEAGLTYSFDLDGDGVYELVGASPVASRVFDDNGTYAARARVSDKDGDYTEYAMDVVVGNVAPASAGLAVGGELKEGSAVILAFGPVTDPSSADTAAGFTYSFDFNGDGVFDVVGTASAVTHVYDDNGTYTVLARVSDKDGGHSDYSTELKIKNVAPKALKFWDNNPIAEGSSVTVGFDAASDPSNADTAAGFTYSYDFNGDGVFDLVTTSPTATHAFNDNGVYVVTGRVTDKDGGYTEYTTDVEVYNVAPTATLTNSGPANEGGSVTVSLSGLADASSADMAAGLTYSFDMDGDGVYEITGASASATRSYRQDGLYTVRAMVTDKDGGSSEYSTAVEVRNVAPVVGSFSTSATTLGNARQGSTVTLSGSFSDAGVLDLHTAVIDWGDGTTSPATVSEANGFGQLSASHVYASGGVFTVSLRLADNASPAGVATANSQAVVTGVGLHNGVLHVVGTNDRDKVTLIRDGSLLRVRTDIVADDFVASNAAVREIRVVSGLGSDKFDTKGDIDQPIYLNGSEYVPPRQIIQELLKKALKLFSDVRVA